MNIYVTNNHCSVDMNTCTMCSCMNECIKGQDVSLFFNSFYSEYSHVQEYMREPITQQMLMCVPLFPCIRNSKFQSHTTQYSSTHVSPFGFSSTYIYTF